MSFSGIAFFLCARIQNTLIADTSSALLPNLLVLVGFGIFFCRFASGERQQQHSESCLAESGKSLSSTCEADAPILPVHFRLNFTTSTSIRKMISFGPHPVRHSAVFFETALSYGLVNLKPILPGHVLVIPKRVVPRFADLEEKEVSDLYLAVHRIGSVVEKEYNAAGLNIAQQDGVAAGQSVPHVHVHILPRSAGGDFEKPDQVHKEIQNSKIGEALKKAEAPDGDVKANTSSDKTSKPEDPFAEESRKVRTQEEMAAEASRLRSLLPEEWRPKFT
ncbi:unnamed protein product [Amoebophrya sp. A25]|nr:unnamed protein product [Amoebophrya sp. A25]|eukprot:GSA25T00024712001.1